MSVLKIAFGEISVRKKCYIKGGELDLLDNRINVITGKNGTGKSLLLSYIHAQTSIETTLISQKNDELIARLTIEDNITLTIKRNEGKRHKIEELLAIFGLTYLLKSNARKLSGGEKRIVAILRGLLSDSSLLLIDEPTNDLDYSKVNKLLGLFKECCKNKTLLIVSHDDRVHKMADSIYVLDEQKLVPKSSKEMIQNGSETSAIERFEKLKPPEKPESVPHKWRSRIYLLSSIRNRTKWFLHKSKHYPNRVQKIFSYHLVVVLFLLTISFLMNFTFEDASHFHMEQLDGINPHQVDIMSPVSIRQNNIAYALPVSLIQIIQEMDTIPNRNALEAYVTRAINMPLSFTLSSLKSENLKLFPLEYWKQAEGRFLQPFEVYVTDILDSEIGVINIDPTQYFIDRLFNPYEESIKIEPLLHEKAVDILHNRYDDESDPLLLIYAVLILNEEFNFWDLTESGILRNFSYGNYWIKSNETIFIINQARIFHAQRLLRNQWFFIGGGLFIANILYAMLYIGVHRKRITILRNYGFEYFELRVKILKKFSSRYIILLSVMLLISINIFLIRDTVFWETLLGFLPGTISVVALLSSYIFARFMIRFYVRRLFHWRAR